METSIVQAMEDSGAINETKRCKRNKAYPSLYISKLPVPFEQSRNNILW